MVAAAGGDLSMHEDGRAARRAAAADIRGGEYVLGVLGPDQMARVRNAAATNTLLATAIAGWERDLAPLAILAGEQAPPPALAEGCIAAVAGKPPP
jgi:anti-sigma-K factor RskA